MKASELREGNWVYKPEADEQTQIFAHGIAAFALRETIRKESEPSMYEPIPLTEEWLFKFGLENGTTQALEKITCAKVMYESWQKCCTLYSGHNCLHVKIQYVHQLQNLYFALTGEELELK